MRFKETIEVHSNNEDTSISKKSFERFSNDIPTLVITLILKRNHPFYTITFLIPIILLTILSPIGLILPGMFNSTARINIYKFELEKKWDFKWVFY